MQLWCLVMEVGQAAYIVASWEVKMPVVLMWGSRDESYNAA